MAAASCLAVWKGRASDFDLDQPYHIVRLIVKKLPSSTLRFALPLGTTFFMTFLVSGFATWRAIGMAPGMVGTWMISWAIAYPTMYFMMPIVRRWLLRWAIEEN